MHCETQFPILTQICIIIFQKCFVGKGFWSKWCRLNPMPKTRIKTQVNLKGSSPHAELTQCHLGLHWIYTSIPELRFGSWSAYGSQCSMCVIRHNHLVSLSHVVCDVCVLMIILYHIQAELKQFWVSPGSGSANISSEGRSVWFVASSETCGHWTGTGTLPLEMRLISRRGLSFVWIYKWEKTFLEKFGLLAKTKNLWKLISSFHCISDKSTKKHNSVFSLSNVIAFFLYANKFREWFLQHS